MRHCIEQELGSTDDLQVLDVAYSLLREWKCFRALCGHPANAIHIHSLFYYFVVFKPPVSVQSPVQIDGLNMATDKA